MPNRPEFPNHIKAASARAAAERIRGRMQLAVESIIEIGRELEEQKKAIGHGNFLMWIQAEFGMSDETARKYRRVAAQLGSKFQPSWNLPVSALYELSSPSTPEPVRAEVLDRAAKGEKVTERNRANLAQFSERRVQNLHRSDLTELERADHIEEWVALEEDERAKAREGGHGAHSSQVVTNESKRADGRGHRPEDGIRAAARELGLPRMTAHRAVTISRGLPREAKEVARQVGLDDNQAALLKAARQPTDEAKIAKLREIADEKDAAAERRKSRKAKRADLSPAEMPYAVARRKVLYEKLHPETAYDARPGRAGKSRHSGDSSQADRFTAATAKATGQSERVIQRAATVGQRIPHTWR